MYRTGSAAARVILAIPEDTNMTNYIGNDPTEVMTLWEEFVPRVAEIQGCAPEDDGYGIILDYDETTGEFT